MVGSRLFSFKGGIHPPEEKYHTSQKAVVRAVVPKVVTIPLHQHIGAPCESLVKPGEQVKMGQKIGQPKGFVSAPVHSSVSGVVKAIESVPHPSGGQVLAVIIENDGLDTIDESITPKDLNNLTQKDIMDVILEAGIVGMGGAAFPTHVKLSPPPDKKIEIAILNGAECEPFLTADHRLMLEQPELVVYGLKAIMKCLGISKGYIAIENNKPDAIKLMEDALKGEQGIEVKALKTKYPQGAEKQIIEALTGRQVPSGKLPMDVGVVVNNVGTAAAIAKAIKTGMPLIDRIVTVTGGAVKEPKNLLLRIGTSFTEALEQCGGLNNEPAKVISGGPMMGIAQHTVDVPVVKGTSGILALTGNEVEKSAIGPCIRCGRCVQVCPINLIPLQISAYALNEDYENAEKSHALDCIECGSCSFICPAKRPLLQSIRVAKRIIVSRRK